VKQLKPDPGANGAEKAGHGQGPPQSVEDINAASWPMVPSAIRNGGALPGPWEALFEPIRSGTVDELIVVGQFGQSLDGRVATETGHSHYINGVDGLAHLHRLRAVVDAVVVGIGTAVADNPQLTVRRVAGPSPARVVIDPHGRLPAAARLLAADGARRLVVTVEGARHALPDDIERLTLPASDGAIAPAAILARLAACGFRRILIEGGANTVSRFLVAGCLDRLHVVVAPMILGTGKPSFTLPPIDRVDRALRPPMRTHILGDEVLFDCDLSAQRLPVGAAKKST
jgi:diaminohydroxyphosphoribosylaminopyrimidine deaminase/5-amino-6-(5-phosphoribosylamino)uracil reductase